MACAACACGATTVGTGTGRLGRTVGIGTIDGSGTGDGSGALVLRTGGLTSVRPRFESPSTLATCRRAGTRARLAGAKYVLPSGALKLRRLVPNARPTLAADPSRRTSIRLAD